MTGERRTFRPTGVILVMWASVLILAILAAIIGLRLPDQSKFTTSQTATIWALIGVFAVFAMIVSASRVTADSDSVRWVNGVRRRSLAWSEVAGISMNAGAPWPTIVTRDGRSFILFAIQGSEGAAAREAVTWLAGHVR